jgi:hypothetical protein
MPAMVSELYDALLSAGAPEEKARKAAESQAGLEFKFSKIEGDLNVLKWMVGANIALIMAVLSFVMRR